MTEMRLSISFCLSSSDSMDDVLRKLFDVVELAETLEPLLVVLLVGAFWVLALLYLSLRRILVIC